MTETEEKVMILKAYTVLFKEDLTTEKQTF